MYRRILTVLIILSIVAVPSAAYGSQPALSGKVYSIKKDEKAPYAGVLLDSIASAKMITSEKYLRAEVELELRKEFQKEIINKNLSLELLQVEFNNYKSLNENILSIREEEITNLNAALKEEMTDYSHWWFAGGVVAGVLLSIGIFYASVEIGK